MKLLISYIFLLVLAPCNSSKKAQSTAAQADYSKLLITYKRTPCFGRCPVYEMSISGETKMMTYTAGSEGNVSKIGTYTKAVSDEELEALVKAFEDAKFFEMEDEYLGMISDFPSKYISFSDGNRSKKIRDRHGAPSALTDLEKKLEAIAESEGWQKSQEGDH